jgi:hypothetical protein
VDIDLAKFRADAQASMTPDEWASHGEESIKAAFVAFGIMRPGESLDDVPDILHVD